MPQCTVCSHKETKQVNVELIAGTPMREIQTRFGASKSALSRHKTSCLPMIIASALQTNVTDEGEAGPEPVTVQGRAEEMSGQSRLAILHALKRKDYKVAFTGMREHRGYVELIGKATGELTANGGEKVIPPMFILPAGVTVSVTVHTPAIEHPEIRNITPPGLSEPPEQTQ